MLLIDSGSSLSIVPVSPCETTRDETNKSTCHSVRTNSEMPVCGQTVMCCETDGLSFQVECIVTTAIAPTDSRDELARARERYVEFQETTSDG